MRFFSSQRRMSYFPEEQTEQRKKEQEEEEIVCLYFVISCCRKKMYVWSIVCLRRLFTCPRSYRSERVVRHKCTRTTHSIVSFSFLIDWFFFIWANSLFQCVFFLMIRNDLISSERKNFSLLLFGLLFLSHFKWHSQLVASSRVD